MFHIEYMKAIRDLFLILTASDDIRIWTVAMFCERILHLCLLLVVGAGAAVGIAPAPAAPYAYDTQTLFLFLPI